jgi:catechol 2,3-dioxygenase-like lactoylglutathione lyase family enzyme
MRVERIDHLVLTVRDVEATVTFYANVLGMELHQAGRELEPKAARPTPGSADLCFVADAQVEELRRRLEDRVELEEGPVERTGALGPMTSFYFRDPDGNLVEVATYRA